MKINKVFFIVFILFFTNFIAADSLSNYTLQNKKSTKWTGDKNWYYNDSEYQYSISIPSKNYTERINIFSIDIYMNLVLEAYKKTSKSKKIIYKLYLEKFGNKDNIHTLYLNFDNEGFKKYQVTTENTIKICFNKKDIPKIIKNLKKSKNFIIKYQTKSAYFNNPNFNEKYIHIIRERK